MKKTQKLKLFHDRHGGAEFGGFFFPSCGDSLELSIEVNTSFSIEVVLSSEAVLVSSEREHRKRDWDRQIDSNLSCLNFILEFPGMSTATGEDGSTVAVLIPMGNPRLLVDDINRFIESLNSHDDHDWTEDLFLVAGHLGGNIVDQGRANEVTLWVFWINVV